jgi:hypothetical protein
MRSLCPKCSKKAKDIPKRDPELAERFHATALGQATFLADLWPQWLQESESAERTKAAYTIVVRAFLDWAGERTTVEEIDKRKAGAFRDG